MELENVILDSVVALFGANESTNFLQVRELNVTEQSASSTDLPEACAGAAACTARIARD